MRCLVFATLSEIVRAVDEKMRVLSLDAGRSQEELSQRAGIAPDTYTHFERTGKVSFERFVRVSVALGRADEIAALFEKPETNEELEDEAPKRKRVRMECSPKRDP